MSVSYVTKAIEKYCLYQKLETIPVVWDAKTWKMKFESRTGHLLAWYFGQTVLLFGVCCCCLIILQQLFQKILTLPLYIIIFQILICFLGMFQISLAMALRIWGDELVFAWNNMVQLERHMISQTGQNSYGNGRFDVFGIGFFLVVQLAFTIPVFLSSVAIFFNLDPFSILLQDILPPEILLTFYPLLFFIRFIITIIAVYEFCRVCVFTAMWVLIEIQLMINCLNLLERNCRVGVCTINYYEEFSCRLRIILNSFSGILELVSLTGMAFGLIVGVLSIFMLIKLHNYIPILLCIEAVILIIVTIFAVQFTVPLVVRIHEQSVDIILRVVRLWVVAANRKYYKQRLESLRPIVMYAGIGGFRFFQVKKSTVLTYYSAISSYSFTALLSIPVNPHFIEKISNLGQL